MPDHFQGVSRSRVAALGAAQTLSWASSYYLPAVLGAGMARDLGMSLSTVFAAFSCALIVSALVGPIAGRWIDRHGGRALLMATNGVFVLGLVGLSLAHSGWALFAAWLVIGVGMGAGLYEAAFAALVRLRGQESRSAITAITLIAGFASTVGWPLSAWMEAQWGWRGACVAWAALHLLVGLPLNALLPRATGAVSAITPIRDAGSMEEKTSQRDGRRWGVGALLALVFAITAFVSTAMAAHLPGVVMAAGATPAMAVLAGALLGPAQVLARVLEWRLLQRWHPLVAARLATALHPVGALLMGVFAGPWGMAFAFLHGAGNGIMTIAKGALPLALFGAQGYGARQGWLMAPARIAQAVAPWLFGLLLERLGAGALWVSSALGVVACLALWAIRPR